MTLRRQATTFARPLAAAILVAPCLLSACGVGRGSSSFVIQSDSALLQPAIATAVYRFTDPNTIDIYLSDFAPDVIDERIERAAEGPPGTILHLHVFLHPKAGKTPIDPTASNAALTCVVFSGSSVGVYGGGAFVLPAASFGDPTFSASVPGASLRLISAGPGFADRLGRASATGGIAASRDDERAQRIASRLTTLLLRH